MTISQTLVICRLQIRDTLRQSIANRIFWVMLTACSLVLVFCMGISIEEGESLRVPDEIALEKPHGHITLAFGAWRLPLFRDGLAMAHFILLVLGEGVFGIVGTLLALVLTAGFIPEFLQAGNATVLLSKPTPRWALLLGRYLGVLTLLGLYAAFYVIGTWLTLGVRTGFWVNSYLWGLPLMVLQVASLYSFSALLGVCSRSNLVCVFGSVLFWMMCWGINYGHHMVVSNQSEIPGQHVVLTTFSEIGYWSMPKPVDLGMILRSTVEGGHAHPDPQLQHVVELGAFHPLWSVVSSLAFIGAMVVMSAQQLAGKDY